MGKTIEFYDLSINGIRKEIVNSVSRCKIIDKKIALHQKKMIEEKATGQKAKFYDGTTPVQHHSYSFSGKARYDNNDNDSKNHKHHTYSGHYTTGGKDMYIGRKTVVRRLKQSHVKNTKLILKLEKKLDKIIEKRQNLKEKLELKGLDVKELVYEPIKEPQELPLCGYCATQIKPGVTDCPVCKLKK